MAVYPNEPNEALYGILKDRYSAGALFEILDAAKKVPRTKDLATALQTLQLKHWAEMGYSPFWVFQVFKLDHSLEDLLSSPYMSMWITYLDDFNKQHQQTKLIDVLLKYYNKPALTKMLEMAKDVPSTKDLATTFQKLQMESWLGDENFMAHHLFKALELDFDPYHVLENPNLKVWYRFVGMADTTKNLDPNALLIESMIRSYDARELLQMLIATKQNPTTEYMITTLQELLQKEFLNKEIPVDDVYAWLGVENLANDDPMTEFFITYRTEFAKRYPPIKPSKPKENVEAP